MGSDVGAGKSSEDFDIHSLFRPPDESSIFQTEVLSIKKALLYQR